MRLQGSLGIESRALDPIQAGSNAFDCRHHSIGQSHSTSTTRPSRKAYLMLLDGQGEIGTSCRIEVRDFDKRGITFHHRRPLHDRRALVVLEGPNQTKIAAEVDLTWCRFSQLGQYTSGGRFVSLADKSA